MYYLNIMFSKVLDIFIATRFMESLEETESVCQFFQVLVEYRSQWRTVLLQQHNITIVCLKYEYNNLLIDVGEAS